MVFITFSRAVRTLEIVMSKRHRAHQAMTGIAMAVAILLPAATSAAPDEGQPDFLRIEWHVVQRDSGARPVGEAWGWVFGDVPARGSGYFAIPLQAAADNYEVRVVSFDPVGYEAP
jgi:hypothetical protein